MKQKKSVTSVYNALYREKLCNHFLGQIFSDDSEKKALQVYTNVYIGKSYVTTVYKCDNRLRRAVIREYMGQIFSDEAKKKRDKCIQCII